MKLALHPGVEVTVCVDGQALTEYEDVGKPIRDATDEGIKYIETKAGSNFVITYRTTRNLMAANPADRLRIRVYIDGKYAWCGVSRSHSHSTNVEVIRTQKDGRAELRRFRFAPLVTDERPLRGEKLEDFKKLGQIEVECTLVRVDNKVGATDGRNYANGFNPLNPDEVLSEKCLKGQAISNRVATGDGEPIPMFGTLSTWYPYGKEPFARYIFKYRSRRDLQIQDIIPRSPSPVSLEDRDLDDLTLEEARELLRRQRSNPAYIKPEEKVKVKKEKRGRENPINADDNDDDDDDDDPIVVAESGHSKKRGRLSNDSGVEIVDLTD